MVKVPVARVPGVFTTPVALTVLDSGCEGEDSARACTWRFVLSGVPVTPVITYVLCTSTLFGVIVTVAEGGPPEKTCETEVPKAPNVPGAATAIPPQSNKENTSKATRASNNTCQPLRRRGGPPAAPPPPAVPTVGGTPPGVTLRPTTPVPAPTPAAPTAAICPELRRPMGVGGTAPGSGSSSGSGLSGGRGTLSASLLRED